MHIRATVVAVLTVAAVAWAAPAPASDDILNGLEQEVASVPIGARGILSFTNQIKDLIEGESTARIYRSSSVADTKVLIERPGQLVERVEHRDFDGDGIADVGVVWRWLGQARCFAFEIFRVDVDGSLVRSFPASDEEPLPQGEFLLPDEAPGGPAGTTFALRHALCEVSRQEPLLEVTRWFGPLDGRLALLLERMDEPTEVHHELNLAAEYYRRGDVEKALQLSRAALERIRLSGPEDLLADAYLAVARGYRARGSVALADAFERRAALRDATFTESAIPEDER